MNRILSFILLLSALSPALSFSCGGTPTYTPWPNSSLQQENTQNTTDQEEFKAFVAETEWLTDKVFGRTPEDEPVYDDGWYW
jgi:hypothetical protein